AIYRELFSYLLFTGTFSSIRVLILLFKTIV
ncbi:unnamed protein product, partial [marine sediment metagenome]